MGLLTDVLSRVDAMKRRAGGLLSNPEDTLAQWMAPDPVDPNYGSVGSVMPGVSQEALHGLLAGNHKNALDIAMQGGMLGKIVYHGSPHSFDKFDMSKIGTGEGAQVYGHGLYFADNEGVAKVYRDALSRSEMAAANGKVVYSPAPKGDYSQVESPAARAASALQYAHDAQSSAPYQLAANVLRRTDDQSAAQQATKILADWQAQGVVPRPSGSLYKVDIPDEAIDKMLHWDKPLSEQPQAVKDALGKLPPIRSMLGGMRGQSYADNAAHFTGADLYQELGASGKAADAAQQLRALGIPGIKYLDQGSRAAKDGTHNYVLFDDALANIVGRE